MADATPDALRVDADKLRETLKWVEDEIDCYVPEDGHKPEESDGSLKHFMRIRRVLNAALASQPPADAVTDAVEQAIQRAGFECALNAYGYWRGDSSGSAGARRYFREGYIGRDADAATYAGIIRHFVTTALHASQKEGENRV